MAQRWNDTDKGKINGSKKNLFRCHLVHHKYNMDLRVNLHEMHRLTARAVEQPNGFVTIRFVLGQFLSRQMLRVKKVRLNL
jgi:hypothetical protein